MQKLSRAQHPRLHTPILVPTRNAQRSFGAAPRSKGRSSRRRRTAADLRRFIGRESYSQKALPATGKERGPLRLGLGPAKRGTRRRAALILAILCAARGGHPSLSDAVRHPSRRLAVHLPVPTPGEVVRGSVGALLSAIPSPLRKRRDDPYEKRRTPKKRDVRVARKRK